MHALSRISLKNQVVNFSLLKAFLWPSKVSKEYTLIFSYVREQASLVMSSRDEEISQFNCAYSSEERIRCNRPS